MTLVDLAQLKRALAERDAARAEVARLRAAAWDEGYRSGHSNAMRRMSDEPNAPTTPNPYREVTPRAEPTDEASP